MIPPLNDPFWIVIGFCSLAIIIPLMTLGLYILAGRAFTNSSIESKWLDAITTRLANIRVNSLFIQRLFKTMPYVAIIQMFIGTFMYYSLAENFVAANIAWVIPIIIWVSIVYLWSCKENKNESKADILSSKS